MEIEGLRHPKVKEIDVVSVQQCTIVTHIVMLCVCVSLCSGFALPLPLRVQCSPSSASLLLLHDKSLSTNYIASMQQTFACFVFATVSLVASTAFGQTWGQCAQSEAQTVASGNMETFAVGVFHDLGRYDVCQVLPASHFCSSFFRVKCITADGSERTLKSVNMCTGGPALGLCLPTSCSQALLNTQLLNYTRNSIPFQMLAGPTGPCVFNMPSDCTAASYGYLEAQCMDEYPAFTTDKSATAVFAVLMALVGVNVLCAAVAYYRRWSAQQVEVDDDENTSLVTNDKINSRGRDAARDPPQSSGRFDVVAWFDVVENSRDFFTVKARNIGDIDTRYFEGVRTIAMLFVVFGHVLYFPTLYNFYNGAQVVSYLKNYGSIGIFPAELAVDTFFFLSAFLFFHLYLKTAEKAAAKSESGELRHPRLVYIPMMILRRYLRMTPVVMLTLASAVWLFAYLPTGSMAGSYSQQQMIEVCKEDWWHQMLYITNLNDKAGWAMCMGWFWYLSADFQLFFFAPLLVAVYFFHKTAWTALVVIGIALITGFQTSVNTMAYLSLSPTSGMNYDKAWIRCNPYFFGLLAATLARNVTVRGWFESCRNRNISYGLGAALMITCINVMWRGMQCYEQRNTQEPMACSVNFFKFMNAYAVSAWGLGMTLVGLPWCAGHGGPIKQFLSLPVFAVASKLTFCCYMLHPLVILLTFADGYGYPQFSPLLQYSSFASAVMITFPSAFLLHVFVEVPFAKMNDALTKMA